MTFSKYRLPNGQIVDIDDDVARGAAEVSFTMIGGEIVMAQRVGRVEERSVSEGIDRASVTTVEHDIIVRFADVVTLPVLWRGKIVVVYVGITSLQKLALGSGIDAIRPSTAADVVEIARRLELNTLALPAVEP